MNPEQKLTVLHIITGLRCGGTERALYNLLACLRATDFDSQVLSLSPEDFFDGKIRFLGVPVHSLGIRRGVPTPGAVAKLYQLVNAVRPDVIQGWMYHGNLAAWTAIRMVRQRPVLVWNVRQSLYGLKNEKGLTRQVIRANRLLSSGPRVILYNSHLSRSQHENFGFAPSGGEVIPNGFDLERFSPSPDRSRGMLTLLGIPDDATIVGHVARLHPMKDHAGFLRAAIRVARSLSDVHFILAGRDVVPHAPVLQGIIPDDLAPRFHFLGERDDVPGLMRIMDVFCLSSRWGEAFPNVLGEAMASCVPCVATDIGDCADIVGDTGLIVPPCDEAVLAQGLTGMLTKPVEERRSLGEAARQRIREHYSLDAVVLQYGELYEGLVAGMSRT